MTLFDENPTDTGDVCGAGVWLLATSGPGPLDEYRAYRTHCQAAPGHLGGHTVRVAGEPDDVIEPVQPVTLTWPNTGPPASGGEQPGAGGGQREDTEPGCQRCGGDWDTWLLDPPQSELRGAGELRWSAPW